MFEFDGDIKYMMATKAIHRKDFYNSKAVNISGKTAPIRIP